VAVKLGYKNVYRDPLGYPEWHARNLPVDSAPAGLAETAPDEQTARPLQGWAMIWTFLGIFAGGIALNLTPCVYPLVPITVSYFSGKTGPGQGGLYLHGASYIGGLAVTNSILGVSAALTGGLMGALLQNPAVLIALAGILVFLATSLFGFWELRLPNWLTRAASKSYSGYFGSLFMGITLGVVAAPCIGPFVLGLLTWVAGMGNPWLGFFIFFTLSLGLGLPLLILAIFAGKLDKLPRSGEWMVWIRKLMGWVLVGMATYFIQPILPLAIGIFLMAAVALAAGIHLGWIDRTTAGFRAFSWLKVGAGIAGVVMTAYLIGSFVIQGPGVKWDAYSDHLLTEAVKSRKPVIIDFTAAWCAPCRELDDITFHDREVVKQSAQDFIMLKVDLTRRGSPDYDRLLRKFEVKGVPTIVFLDRQGQERRDLRLVDFLPPDQFLIRMAEAKKGSPKLTRSYLKKVDYVQGHNN
jgi:thiol:disulfide interchange protein DsbD